jgi:hypothetical protein
MPEYKPSEVEAREWFRSVKCSECPKSAKYYILDLEGNYTTHICHNCSLTSDAPVARFIYDTPGGLEPE